ncbi:MAG TPA: hypothetical protein ENH60_03095 [Pricia sp.]|nr:hypothetical protein [Pricia sp.]
MPEIDLSLTLICCQTFAQSGSEILFLHFGAVQAKKKNRLPLIGWGLVSLKPGLDRGVSEKGLFVVLYAFLLMQVSLLVFFLLV